MFAEQLKYLRRSKGLNQVQLGENLDINKDVVICRSSIERSTAF